MGCVDRRTDPGDRDRMLFYLLIKKDGTTVFPAPDAVHPLLASSSLLPRGDSTPQPAAAPAVPDTHLQQRPPEAPQPLVPTAAASAAEAAVHNMSDQAVSTSHASATQVSTANSDQPAGPPSAVSPQPDPSMQQEVQQAAACELGPHVSGSSGSLLEAAASNLQACAPSLPAVPASPQLSDSSQLPQPLLPQLAPASPQLQPVPPQLQPASSQLQPALHSCSLLHHSCRLLHHICHYPPLSLLHQRIRQVVSSQTNSCKAKTHRQLQAKTSARSFWHCCKKPQHTWQAVNRLGQIRQVQSLQLRVISLLMPGTVRGPPVPLTQKGSGRVIMVLQFLLGQLLLQPVQVVKAKVVMKVKSAAMCFICSCCRRY